MIRTLGSAMTVSGIYRVERNYANIVFSPAWKENTAIA